MKFDIAVDTIPGAGMAIEERLEREWVAFVLGDLFRAGAGPFRLRLDLLRRDTNVTVDGVVELDYVFDCSRCAEETADQCTVPIRLAFTKGCEEADEGGDIDVWGLEAGRETAFHDGTTVRLEQPIIEQVVFALPTYPLCREDCRGLCPDCGTNLNRASCDCADKRTDPRWSELAKLKLGE